jgi:hypothetical protein
LVGVVARRQRGLAPAVSHQSGAIRSGTLPAEAFRGQNWTADRIQNFGSMVPGIAKHDHFLLRRQRAESPCPVENMGHQI